MDVNHGGAMVISVYNSVKIRWISFAAIACVILGHSLLENGTIQNWVVPIFAQWHVPWFFVLSGMMMAYSLENHSFSAMLLKKLRGLVIPYFLWCVFCWGVSGHWRGTHIGELLGISTAFPIGNPHLWYLHCLIVFSFVAILLWKVVTSRVLFFAAWYVVFFGLAEYWGGVTFYGTPTSPFYFLLGFVAAKIVLREEDCRPHRLLAIVVLLVAVGSRLIWFRYNFPPCIEMILRASSIVSQIAAFWLGYDLICEKWRIESFPRLVSPIFFVYCCHGPILLYMRNAWTAVLGNSKVMANVGMFVLWVTVMAISFAVANIVRRCVPRIYGLLTGGR